VARLDRFARSAIDALESIKRLNDAGARLVSVEDGFDGSTAMGRFAIGILTLIAELELERIRESWKSATEQAVGRGIHISAQVPTGYRRDEHRRLVPAEPAASAIRECFRRRATGVSWAWLTHYLEGQDVYPATGNKHWSKQTVASMLRNRVYLGEARSGGVVNPNAHKAIVTQAEFDAAQNQTTLLTARNGSVASNALLGGIIRCAGCGHTLKITGTTNRKTGEREPVYYCIGRYATGPCPARASARAASVDPHVENEVLQALRAEGGIVAEARAASDQLQQAQREAEAAEHELDLFLQSNLLSVIGEQKFLRGVLARQESLDEARTRLTKARSQATLIDELTDGDLLKAWPLLTAQEKRRLLHGLLDRVLLSRAGHRGRAAPPIASRTQIVLRGNVLLGPNPDDQVTTA
jgi:hypothetical protein